VLGTELGKHASASGRPHAGAQRWIAQDGGESDAQFSRVAWRHQDALPAAGDNLRDPPRSIGDYGNRHRHCLGDDKPKRFVPGGDRQYVQIGVYRARVALKAGEVDPVDHPQLPAQGAQRLDIWGAFAICRPGNHEVGVSEVLARRRERLHEVLVALVGDQPANQPDQRGSRRNIEAHPYPAPLRGVPSEVGGINGVMDRDQPVA
jgi:hypothetical protein